MHDSIADLFYQELQCAQFIEFLISDFWILPPTLIFAKVLSTSRLDGLLYL